MNYYQSSYVNPYLTQQQMYTPPSSIPQQIYNPPPQPTPQPTNTLCGKVVDNIDLVKIQELLPGQIGIYPQADETCVYIKKWLPNNQTTILTYVPQVIEEEVAETPDPYADTLSSIQQSIKDLGKKIDGIGYVKTPVTSMSKVKKKENTDE